MTKAPVQELMAVLCAREVREGQAFGVGIQSQIAAAGAVLAKSLHAPGAPLLTRGLPKSELLLGTREPHQLAMQGKMDLFFLTPAQVDAAANVNFERVKQGDDWQNLSGAFAVPVYYSVVRRVVLLCPTHSPSVLVDKVDYITASGSPARREDRTGGLHKIITSKAVLVRAASTGALELESYHPGESVESVQAATGFELGVAANVHETRSVSADEKTCLETQVYPALAHMALSWRQTG